MLCGHTYVFSCEEFVKFFCIGLFAFLLLSCRSSKVKFLLWFFWVPYEDTLMKDFAQSLAHNHASKEPNLMVDRSA